MKYKRTMYFDIIQDTRFSADPKLNVNKWISAILETLNKFPVKYNIDNMRVLPFSADAEEAPFTSYRQRIYVKKEGRISWNEIQQAINEVKICCFEFLPCVKIKTINFIQKN